MQCHKNATKCPYIDFILNLSTSNDCNELWEVFCFFYFLSCINLGKFSFTSVVEKKCQVDSTLIMQTAAVAVWTKWYLAREVFDTFRAGLSRSELEQDSSRTHQFAGHSLPGGRVLSQVDFPK